MSSSNTLRSSKSNIELSSTLGRRPSTAPLDNWLAGETGEGSKSPWFTSKYGKRYHALWNVPWPLSYEREILDFDVLNYQYLEKMHGLTFVEFESPPKKVLDIGTGLGSWIIDAAQQWPETEFVGLDIVPIQTDSTLLEPSVCKRIEWVTSNFLQRLPFDEGTFDHVRCCNIAKGVPENKWVSLLEEIARVMVPGASLEVIVEDIVFPYVTSSAAATSPVSPFFGRFTGLPRHDHYFLEQIFFDVFERRFINTRPLKILSNYLNIHLTRTREVPIQSAIPAGDREPGNETSAGMIHSGDDLSAWTNEMRAFAAVRGCKETMWEEVALKSKELGGDILTSLPWTEKERALTPRQQFELLFDRYEQEMRERSMGLSLALTKRLGWSEPGNDRGMSLSVLEGGLERLDKEPVRLSQSSGEDADSSSPMSCCFVAYKP